MFCHVFHRGQTKKHFLKTIARSNLQVLSDVFTIVLKQSFNMPNRENSVSRAGNIGKLVGKPGNILFPQQK